MSIEEIMVVAMFASFILLLFTGYPVAWILGGTAVLWAFIGHVMVQDFGADLWFSWSSSIKLVPERMWDLVGKETLVALPMFVFMGIMLDRSGVAERLMNNIVKLFGRMRGGYTITVIVIGVLLAASTGIIGASVVLLGMLSLPVMLGNGYNKSLAVGTACSVGTLGILIPPSIMLVLMADRLSDPAASVGDLFMGALLPGLLLATLYILYAIIYPLFRPEVAPIPADAEKITWRIVGDALLAVIPTAFLILAVLGSIFFGIATPTEASGVGAAGAMLLAAINCRLNFQVLRDSLQQTTKTTAFIFAIFLGATAFSVVLRGLGGDTVIEEALLGLDMPPLGVLAVVLFTVFLLGFVLDWVEITLIVLPLVAPIMKTLGFDIVWFSILFAVCLQTSFLTPPVGFALFYIKGVCPPEITTMDVYKGVIPYILMQLLALVIIVCYPPIVTWLPSVAY